MKPELGIGAAAYQDDEIDLKALALALWAGRWWIFGAAFLSALCGLLVALSLSNEYRVSTTLAAPEANGKGGLSALAGSLGGLAAMAGVSLPGGGGNTAVALADLQSNQLLGRFIREENIKPLLFSGAWDAETQQWLPRPAPGLVKGALLAIIDDPYQRAEAGRPTLEPSDAEAVEFFRKEVLAVSQDKKTELVTVSITWRDPAQAAVWLNKLVQRLNVHTRKHMMEDADKSLAYLQAELMRTQEMGVRQSMYSLMEAKLNGRMMASVTEEVAFRVIDPPVVPNVPASPQRALIVFLAMVLGGMVAGAVILVRYQWQQGEAVSDVS